MKRILIFSTAYFPFVGGAEVAVREITDRLAGDFSFDMITARLSRHLPGQEKIGQVNVWRLGWGCGFDKYWLALRGAAFAKKMHRQKKYDAIWSIMASYNGFAAARFKKLFPRTPYLLTLQEGDPFDYILKKVWLVRPWFKKIFQRADFVQAISQYLADWATQMGFLGEMAVVPNAVDLNQFSQNQGGRREKIRTDLKIKADEKLVITVSRLVKKNGVIDLIAAMRFLPDSVKLLVVGEGLEKAALLEEIKKLKLETSVILTGLVEPDRVPDYLFAADVFVRASLSEGLGNVFLEAMAAGLPVIGTRVGGIVDFLKDEETGLYCEVQNPADIAKKIEKLLNNAPLREKIINQGRALVKEKYSWDKNVLLMQGIFNKLIIK